jgi:hypothetical protein
MPTKKENSGLSLFCLSIVLIDFIRNKTFFDVNSKNEFGSLYQKIPNSNGIKADINAKPENLIWVDFLEIINSIV